MFRFSFAVGDIFFRKYIALTPLKNCFVLGFFGNSTESNRKSFLKETGKSCLVLLYVNQILDCTDFILNIWENLKWELLLTQH